MLFMSNVLVKQILQQVYDAAKTVESRFTHINDVQDFTHSPDGKMVLDSIC